MEDKKRSAVESDKEIIHSKAIKAGKRIYYLDVKKNRKDEMFISVTESKKVVTGEGIDPQVSFEKHKIFLYQEDFEKFMESMKEMIQYIEEKQGPFVPYINRDEEETAGEHHDIKIDIDF